MRRGIANSRHARIFETAAVLALLSLWSAAWVWFFYRRGYLAYYGDAEAHLNIARRILDSRTPGYDELGSVWLPLPHVLMLLFARNDALWRSALAGSIPSGICFVLAGAFLFAAARRVFDSTAAAVSRARLLFAINPNVLYLQSTAMTEPLFMAALLAVLYFTVRFRDTQGGARVCGAGLAALCGTLTRYDGWFLIPFVALFVLVTAKRQRVAKAALFAAIACLGPLYWLGHNWWCCSNVLDFYNGPYSPKGIQGSASLSGPRQLGQGLASISAPRCAGARERRCVWLGAAGLVACVAVRKARWPALLLVAARRRSMCGACTLRRARRSSCRICGPTATTTRDMGWRSSPPWHLAQPRWCRWFPRARSAGGRRGGVGSGRALADPSAAGCLDHLEGIAGQLRSAPRVDARGRGVSRAALPARIGNHYHFRRYYRHLPRGRYSAARDADLGQLAALAGGSDRGPDLFLWEEWAVVMGGDPVQTALLRAGVRGPRYELVKTVMVPHAPVVEIYHCCIGLTPN